MTPATSDRGRAAVYEAEETAFGGTPWEAERPLARLVAMADEVTAGEWWRSCGGPAVAVMSARGDARSSSARVGPVVARVDIHVADEQRRPSVMAHELAHALAGVGHGHDATFRAAHVDVVAVLAGASTAADLRAAYEQLAVPPGTRCWPSPVRVTGAGFVVVP